MNALTHNGDLPRSWNGISCEYQLRSEQRNVLRPSPSITRLIVLYVTRESLPFGSRLVRELVRITRAATRLINGVVSAPFIIPIRW